MLEKKELAKEIDHALKEEEKEGITEEKNKKDMTKAERARIKIWQPDEIQVMDKDITIGERKYRLIYDHREAFQQEEFAFRFSEVLSRYDYVVGDWGFESLRLRGFFNANHKKSQADQRIDNLQEYLYEYCNFGCAFFVLERIGGNHEKNRLAKEETYTHTKRKKRTPAHKNKHLRESVKEAHIEEKTVRPFVKKTKHTTASQKSQPRNEEKQYTTHTPKEKRPFTIRTNEK